MSADAKIAELGLELPPAPKPMGVYKPLVIAGNMAYVSGHGPLKSDKTLITGRVGGDIDKQAGYDAARQTGLAILATLQAGLGSLDRVKRVIKVLGMVNSTPDFGEQPAVINGCSELFAKVWGEDAGVGARSAVGMGALTHLVIGLWGGWVILTSHDAQASIGIFFVPVYLGMGSWSVAILSFVAASLLISVRGSRLGAG